MVVDGRLGWRYGNAVFEPCDLLSGRIGGGTVELRQHLPLNVRLQGESERFALRLVGPLELCELGLYVGPRHEGAKCTDVLRGFRQQVNVRSGHVVLK